MSSDLLCYRGLEHKALPHSWECAVRFTFETLPGFVGMNKQCQEW